MEQIISEIKQRIRENPGNYPVVAAGWEIAVQEKTPESVGVEFGHFRTAGQFCTPFYKPVSKIINLEKLHSHG